MSDDGVPVAFHDLPADAFPFDVVLVDEDTDEVLWQFTVEGPGAIEVPGFGGEGRKVTAIVNYPEIVHVTTADGRTTTYEKTAKGLE